MLNKLIYYLCFLTLLKRSSSNCRFIHLSVGFESYSRMIALSGIFLLRRWINLWHELSAQFLSARHLDHPHLSKSYWQMFTRVRWSNRKFFYFGPNRLDSRKGAENLFLMTVFRRARENLNSYDASVSSIRIGPDRWSPFRLRLAFESLHRVRRKNMLQIVFK